MRDETTRQTDRRATLNKTERVHIYIYMCIVENFQLHRRKEGQKKQRKEESQVENVQLDSITNDSER